MLLLKSLAGVAVMLLPLAAAVHAAERHVAVTWDNGVVRELNGENNGDPSAQAWFKDALAVEGWNYLTVKSNPNYPDDVQAYSAGYVEGKLTAPQIYNHAINTGAVNAVSQKVRETAPSAACSDLSLMLQCAGSRILGPKPSLCG